MTALRLPDPFTPGVTEAGAATPTCCCCCCCCAVSSVSAAIALPSALRNDLAETDSRASASLIILPAALFPLLVLVSPIIDFDNWIYALLCVGFPAALLWAGFASWLAGAPRPWRGSVRLLVWSLAFCVEFFLALPLLAVLANLGTVVGGIVYFGLAAAAGWLVVANYRRPR